MGYQIINIDNMELIELSEILSNVELDIQTIPVIKRLGGEYVNIVELDNTHTTYNMAYSTFDKYCLISDVSIAALLTIKTLGLDVNQLDHLSRTYLTKLDLTDEELMYLRKHIIELAMN